MWLRRIVGHGSVKRRLLPAVRALSLTSAGQTYSRCRPIAIPESTSVFEFLRQQGRWDEAAADKPAIVDAISGEVVRYGELEQRINGCAHALHDLGFRQGDVLSIHLHNCPEFIVAFLAASSLGGATSPSNPAYVGEELGRQLVDSSAKIILTGHQYRDVVSGALEALGSGPRPYVSFVEDADCFARAPLQSAPIPLPRRIIPKEDLVVLPYSSGTTGRPKGVMLSHYNLVANVLQLNSADPFARFAFDGTDTMLGLLPLYHIYGMTVLMLGALANQSTLALLPKFEPVTFLRAIEQHRITVACLVPPLCLFLAKSPDVAHADLSSLKYIYSGAAPLDAAQELAVVQRLGGNVQIRQAYGMTETAPIILVGGEHEHVPGYSGRLVPNTACKIVDVETGAVLPVGAEGELVVRGPQVMLGYKERPEATAECLSAVASSELAASDGDGADYGSMWMRTGDMASIDEDGNVRIAERLKELIKSRGFQVAPAEVEAMLLEDDDVTDACVIGIAHERYGEVPKAFIVPRQGSLLSAEGGGDEPARAEALMAKLRPRMAEYKWPAEVAFVEAIPKSPSGKILRRLLRDTGHAAS